MRLRPDVVDALAEIRADDARPILLALLERERYQSMRPREARALATLGAREELVPALRRFAGVPDPMIDALPLMVELELLDARRGGQRQPKGPVLDATVKVPARTPLRLLVIADRVEAVRADAHTVVVGDVGGAVRVGDVPPTDGETTRITVTGEGVSAVWLVPASSEIPPPPPGRWDGGSPRD